MIIHVLHLIPATILSIVLVFTSGSPINEEDAASLLPDTPTTKNETVAAIVQDPVVRDAVQSAVGNSTLSGLIVRKSVLIIPVDSPDTVLSQKHQILMAPTTHLEDIRRNITESLRAEAEIDDAEVTEVDEFGVSVLVPLNGTDLENEESSTVKSKQVIDSDDDFVASLSRDSDKSAAYENDAAGKIEFSKANEETVAVPVALLLESSDAIDGKLKVVALLPAPRDESDLRNELDFLKRNREEIQNEVRNHVGSFRSAIEKARREERPNAKIEVGRRDDTTAFTSSSKDKRLDEVSRTTIIAADHHYLDFPGKSLLSRSTVTVSSTASERRPIIQISNEARDMATAEDIVFRPLFKFQREEKQKSKLQIDAAYERSSHRRYVPYKTYVPYRPYGQYERRYSYDDHYV